MALDAMPRLGLDTYSDDDRDQWRGNVRTALDVGVRHVDTAQVYQNETYVGRGLRDSAVDRDDVFLATKTVHHDVPEIQDVAEKHDATPAQVSLAWLLTHDNVTAIPKASSRERVEQNLAALDLELDQADIELVDSIERRHREIDPEWGPWNW